MEPSPKVTIVTLSTGRSCAESRYLQLFQERTQPQLATFFSDGLWGYKILQLAFRETPIKNALIALVSSHEAFINGEPFETKSVALLHYNQAIKQMLHDKPMLNNAGMNLISCVIFACVEVSGLLD